jgi:hypothetical protein
LVSARFSKYGFAKLPQKGEQFFLNSVIKAFVRSKEEFFQIDSIVLNLLPLEFTCLSVLAQLTTICDLLGTHFLKVCGSSTVKA